MKLRIAAGLLVICGLSITMAHARTATKGFEVVEEKFVGVTEDGAFKLADGNEAVLAGIYFPDPSLKHAALQPYVDALKDVPGSNIYPCRLHGTDRYGRLLIVAYTGSASSVQDDLLREGSAVFYDPQGKVQLNDIPGWPDTEEEARRAHRGVWAEKDFVLSSDHAAGHDGEFHLVEGIVRHIYQTRETTYLNFGEDWKTDFSVTIPRHSWHDFGNRMENLEGKKLRVRGIVYEDHGPTILITSLQQLEMLK